MTRTQPRDRRGRFATVDALSGPEYEQDYQPPAEQNAAPRPPIDITTFDMAAHLEDWHGPEFADTYRRLLAGGWEYPKGELTKQQRTEAEVMAYAARYDLAIRTGRDPLTVLKGEDDDGFIDGKWAGYDKHGRPAFGHREEIERLERAVRDQGFGRDGMAPDGSPYGKLGTDVRAFFPPDEVTGVRWNLLTNSPFDPPPTPMTWDGYRKSDGKRRMPDGSWKRHPNYPKPYWE
ncbi:MAG: hypothetical protein J0H96_07645 [Microbacterium ginsengisoli]|nr:hypothetical protein [Microbacterium ginsengisoli]